MWAAAFSPIEFGVHPFTTSSIGPKCFNADNLTPTLTNVNNFFTQGLCSEVSTAWKDSPRRRSPMISNETKLYRSKYRLACEPFSATLRRSRSRLMCKFVGFWIRGSCFFSARLAKPQLQTFLIRWWSSVLRHALISGAFMTISGIVIFGLGSRGRVT